MRWNLEDVCTWWASLSSLPPKLAIVAVVSKDIVAVAMGLLVVVGQ